MGLKDRERSGRPPELSGEVSHRIKKELKESNNHGWSTKQVEELIARKSGIKYHSIHTCRILRRWGFKQKVPGKVHVNTASMEEKDDFKKRPPGYLWISNKKKKVLPWYLPTNHSSFMIPWQEGCGLTGEKASGKGNGLAQALMCFWSRKH